MEAGGVWGEAGPQAGQLHYLLANVLTCTGEACWSRWPCRSLRCMGEVGRNMGRDVARTASDTIRQMNTQIGDMGSIGTFRQEILWSRGESCGLVVKLKIFQTPPPPKDFLVVLW